MNRALVFGGARSGKSAYAERLAAASGKEVVYIATAQLYDAEMAARIEQHRLQRQQYQTQAAWTTIEEPLRLGEVIREHATPARVLLIDCLTVWLGNLLFAEKHDYPEIGRIDPPASYVEQRDDFLTALEQARGDIVLVSNEVGMGIVPTGAISRWFVDEAGRLNQAVAARCESVAWVAAGLPLMLKDE